MNLINHFVNKYKINPAEIEIKKYFDQTKKINCTLYCRNIHCLYQKLYKNRRFNSLALENFILTDKYFDYYNADENSARINNLLKITLFYTDLKN